TAFGLPSGPGIVVVPIKDPTLTSASETLVMPSTLVSPFMYSFTSSPLRDLTVSMSPSALSTVPRIRDGVGAFWANTQEEESAITATAMTGRTRLLGRRRINESPVSSLQGR